MPCILGDKKDAVHHQFLKSGEKDDTVHYRQRLIDLNQKLIEKRPDLATRYEEVI